MAPNLSLASVPIISTLLVHTIHVLTPTPSMEQQTAQKYVSPSIKTNKRKPFRFPRPKSIEKKPWTRSTYFEAREQKLVAQAPNARTRILCGTCIYFTGVKSTSQRRLETIVWHNGGTVVKMWHRTRVTHVVADCLAASKVEKELVVGNHSAPIVTPLWIRESLRRGKKLPTWHFQVVRGPPDVRDVASFFRAAKPSDCDKHDAHSKPLSKKHENPAPKFQNTSFKSFP